MEEKKRKKECALSKLATESENTVLIAHSVSLPIFGNYLIQIAIRYRLISYRNRPSNFRRYCRARSLPEHFQSRNELADQGHGNVWTGQERGIRFRLFRSTVVIVYFAFDFSRNMFGIEIIEWGIIWGLTVT